jgi:probable rRNA maturation factor
MAVTASGTGSAQTYDVEPLARDAQVLLDALGLSEWELSLLVCDDLFIAPLNQQWRDKDGPTDVLSFPQLDLTGPDDAQLRNADDGPHLLGDVVISLDTAARQARERSHGVEDELRVLLVHGLCHLVGHTHEQDSTRARMREREAALLTALGRDADGLVARADGGEWPPDAPPG